MRVLITGSSGHLGEALCRSCKQQDIDYVSIDINNSDYTTHVGSIVDKQLIDELMSGVDFVLHVATLHKPHVATHHKQAFIDTNITGTVNLLEASVKAGVKGFMFTSTTSTFGDSLRPEPGEPAAWITEDTPVIPKNIYGVTKTAAEDLCQLFHRNHGLPCIVLRTSRFFLEEDDNALIRDKYEDLNIKANEFTHRRVDIQDVVDAHFLAIKKVEQLQFEKYIISATSAFTQEHLQILNTNAPAVIHQLYPQYEKIYASRNWQMFPTIGRVYVNTKAIQDLGWEPKYDFGYILDCLKKDKPFYSPLTKTVGIKYYHKMKFRDGPYPV